jgi:hypothetical protein
MNFQTPSAVRIFFVMRTCFLKDREVKAWDEGEGAGLIGKYCYTDASLVSIL